MDASLLQVVGQVAGLGGIALGILMLIFRDVIRKQIFATLTKDQSYRLLRLLLVLTWSIALAGIVAWVWASGRGSPTTSAAPPPQTTFEFRDSTTNDPVYRTPLDVEYILKGQPRAIAKLPDNHRGKWTIQAPPEDVTIEAVSCDGYLFDPEEQGELSKGIVRLDRSHRFAKAITPPIERVQKVSLDAYRTAVKDQPAGEIRLTCRNQTRFYLSLALVRWAPVSDAKTTAETRTKETILAPCPRKEEKEYAVTDSQPGGYYYVFGSVCGLEGQLLWSGSLHGPPDPVFEVTMSESVARDPELRAVLVQE